LTLLCAHNGKPDVLHRTSLPAEHCFQSWGEQRVALDAAAPATMTLNAFWTPAITRAASEASAALSRS
jgi:hypothetical protein